MTDTDTHEGGRFDVRAAIAIARIATNKPAHRVPDGHGPARTHSAKRRPGIEGAEREQDRTEQQYEDDREEIRTLPSGGLADTSGDTAVTATTVATSTTGPAPKTQLESRGRIRCLAKSLRRSSRADGSVRRRGLETTTNLAHESEEERTANGDGRHLEERDQDLVRTWVSPFTPPPPRRSRAPRNRTRGSVHATVLEPTRALTPPPHAGNKRSIEVTFKNVVIRRVIGDALDVVARFNEVTDVEVARGRMTSSKTRCSGSANEVAVYCMRAVCNFRPDPTVPPD